MNNIVYVSEYLVANQKGYTKHYYMEGQRIASKIGKGGIQTIDVPITTSENMFNKANNSGQVIMNYTYPWLLTIVGIIAMIVIFVIKIILQFSVLFSHSTVPHLPTTS